MTLTGLLIRIAITAIILTGLNFGLKKSKPEWADIKNWVITFLQHFVGALFIFSGYVKAIDPKGTAYKMEQYFGEFETHFSDVFLPLWHVMEENSLVVSLIMIIFEIVLGVMLLLGYTRKLTAWLFLLLVVFFTFLTGFTYLTGYVPEGVNFFNFGSWGPYIKTNMKVTDCGCFGDFIKLEPKTSFYKDVFLLIPAFIFLIFASKKHVLFNKTIRNIIMIVSTIIVTGFCYMNTYMGLPFQDFRPFKEGTNVRQVKLDEEEAQANAKLFYIIKQKDTGEIKRLEMNDYLAMWKDPEFKTKWETVEQYREDVKTTKISEFHVSNEQGEDIAEEIIAYEDYQLMFVAYKWDFKAKVVNDSTSVYTWNKSYANQYSDKVNPLLHEAANNGIKVFGICKPYSPDEINAFRTETGAKYPIYTADDILLKTIVRSNPGVLLWKDGKILKKWHINHLPNFNTIKTYMK